MFVTIIALPSHHCLWWVPLIFTSSRDAFFGVTLADHDLNRTPKRNSTKSPSRASASARSSDGGATTSTPPIPVLTAGQLQTCSKYLASHMPTTNNPMRVALWADRADADANNEANNEAKIEANDCAHAAIDSAAINGQGRTAAVVDPKVRIAAQRRRFFLKAAAPVTANAIHRFHTGAAATTRAGVRVYENAPTSDTHERAHRHDDFAADATHATGWLVGDDASDVAAVNEVPADMRVVFVPEACDSDCSSGEDGHANNSLAQRRQRRRHTSDAHSALAPQSATRRRRHSITVPTSPATEQTRTHPATGPARKRGLFLPCHCACGELLDSLSSHNTHKRLAGHNSLICFQCRRGFVSAADVLAHDCTWYNESHYQQDLLLLSGRHISALTQNTQAAASCGHIYVKLAASQTQTSPNPHASADTVWKFRKGRHSETKQVQPHSVPGVIGGLPKPQVRHDRGKVESEDSGDLADLTSLDEPLLSCYCIEEHDTTDSLVCYLPIERLVGRASEVAVERPYFCDENCCDICKHHNYTTLANHTHVGVHTRSNGRHFHRLDEARGTEEADTEC